MITSVEIKNLRGIQEGKLEELTPLVVLVGPNGCGKSTVLDAALLGSSPSPGHAIGRVVQRHAGLTFGARWLFERAQIERGIGVLVTSDTGATRQSAYSWSFSNPINSPAIMVDILQSPDDRPEKPQPGQSNDRNRTAARFSADNSFEFTPVDVFLEGVPAIKLIEGSMFQDASQLQELYSRVVELGQRDVMADVLANVLPSARDLTLLSSSGIPVLNVEYSNKAVPLAISGDGIVMLTGLALTLVTATNGTVLVEEPEAHLHPAAIWQSARAIWAAVRRGIQVILTTHSIELIDALNGEAVTDAEIQKLTVYRLQLLDGCMRNSRIDGLSVARLRASIEEDLR